MPYPTAHPMVMQRTQAVLELQPLYLDTETTGTGQTDRIIQIAIVDMNGEPLFQSLVNPGVPIPAESSAVNGITDEMVADAPCFEDIASDVFDRLNGRLFIAHNAAPRIVPNGGSSIFFHIWRSGGGRASSGCTTMSEPALKEMIAWIDPTALPVYVLLPESEYQRLRGPWGLPSMTSEPSRILAYSAS